MPLVHAGVDTFVNACFDAGFDALVHTGFDARFDAFVHTRVNAELNTGLHTCLDAYNTGKFEGKDCPDGKIGQGFFRGQSAYSSASDCYTACYMCVSNAIDAGAGDVMCEDYESDAKCWMGYH